MHPSRGWLQIRTHHLALVEHKAVTVVMRTVNLLEVFKHAAFELVDALDAFGLDVMAAFSQRMLPVQNETTVFPMLSSRCAAHESEGKRLRGHGTKIA